jgi:HAD superfamily hydrolase (TIGR01509 family)
MIQAVLFDFNGVLLQDSTWHEEAWNELSIYLRGNKLTETECATHIHSRTPQDSLSYILGHAASFEEKQKYLDRKETLYQKIALAHTEEFQLTFDAKEFFTRLESAEIKKTIATSSPLVLVQFYYKYLGLEQWFPFEEIIFNDGTFPGKPAPDIFKKAAKKLDVDISNCIVVEDAKSGIDSARAAGAGKVFLFLNGNNTTLADHVQVDKIIRNFSEITQNDLV